MVILFKIDSFSYILGKATFMVENDEGTYYGDLNEKGEAHGYGRFVEIKN